MDNVTSTKMSLRKERWKQLILDRQASGFTIDKWCELRGLKKSTYYKWLRIIRKEACQALPEPQAIAPVPFVQIDTENAINIVPNTATVPQPAITPNTGIHIQLRGADITIADGTSPQTIRATLLALKKLC
jgi:hypothetical protein